MYTEYSNFRQIHRFLIGIFPPVTGRINFVQSIFLETFCFITLVNARPKFIEYLPSRQSLFKVNNKNTRTWCELCSKLTMKTPERRQWRCSGVFIVNFEHISLLVLVFLMLTLSR